MRFLREANSAIFSGFLKGNANAYNFGFHICGDGCRSANQWTEPPVIQSRPYRLNPKNGQLLLSKRCTVSSGWRRKPEDRNGDRASIDVSPVPELGFTHATQTAYSGRVYRLPRYQPCGGAHALFRKPEDYAAFEPCCCWPPTRAAAHPGLVAREKSLALYLVSQGPEPERYAIFDGSRTPALACSVRKGGAGHRRQDPLSALSI